MSRVIVELSMSLDGCTARPDDRTDEVHAWFFNGDVEVKLPNDDMVFKTDPLSAELIRETFGTYGANVTGRRTFDIANA
jgi:dihydrofolate reductase